MNARQEVEMIRKALKHYTTKKLPDMWLNTGSRRLHTVMGDPNKGLAYGKLYEVAGLESSGKSAMVMEIAAAAQVVDNAFVAWIDAEKSWTDEWAVKRGLDPKRVALFQPVPMMEKGVMRLTYAEETFSQAQAWIVSKVTNNPQAKIFLGIDSLPALMPREIIMGGWDKQGMAVRARFNSYAISLWNSIAATFNPMVMIVNQLRINPGVRFGDPVYTPGGEAFRYFASVRVRMRRGKKKGRLLKDGKQYGVKGIIKNYKNKTGGQEFEEIGYKMAWEDHCKFVDIQDIEPVEEGQ